MLYKNLESLINYQFKNKKIENHDINLLKNHFTKNNIITLLNDILNQPDLIHKIANCSYLHTLGFYKLVLLDSNKDLSLFQYKTQVRLHLWKPENDSVPVVESLHEHSFNFVSTVLTGKLENQSFSKTELSFEEKKVLDHLLNILPLFTDSEKLFLEEQIEILLTLKLKELHSQQFDKQFSKHILNVEQFKKITKFTDEEIDILINIQGFYKSNRIPGDKKDYKHILEEYISLKPYKVEKLHKGNFYFHPYTLPHRLFYDNQEYNSTILVTSHIPENPDGGSFQRATYHETEEKDYSKKAISEKELIYLLEEYIQHLSK